MNTAAAVIYWYQVGLGWIGVGLYVRHLIRLKRASRAERDEHRGADLAYADELHQHRMWLSGEAQIPIVAPRAVHVAASPLIGSPYAPGWAKPTGEHPAVEPVHAGTHGRRRTPTPPRPTRTVVPVAPPPAWAAGYQPGPVTREFNRIVGDNFPVWEQDELDLTAVAP